MIGMTDDKRKKAPAGMKHASFRQFLSAYRTPILILLLLFFGGRVFLVIRFPHAAYDEIRYTAPAVNMLAGRGFSLDVSAPYRPSEHTMPLYPLFIASVYAVFGENNSAVRIAQSAVDLITCLLVAFVSFNLAAASLRKAAAIFSLIIYGCLSWFTVFWTRYILTETLAIFLTMLAVAMGIWALRGGRWRWLIVGAICGLAILTRADSVLLVFAFLLFLAFQIVPRSFAKVVSLLFFCAAIALVLTPWIVRNYIVFQKFQPLASEYGRPRGEFVPTGYVMWIRTWMTDETNYHAGDLIFHQGSRAFDPRQLPDHMFDSVEEREEVSRLIARYNQIGEMTPELSDKFRDLANARIKRAPLRFYVWLPLRRIASMWLTGFVTTSRFHMFLRILFVLPILIGGVLGFVIWARNPALVALLALIILTRTIFFAFYGAEARYIVEAYPPMIAACGVTGAVLWGYLNQFRKKQWP